MIGFRPQTVSRRPVYSDMGEKLCYVESGPEGEWITDLEGRKIGRITKHRRTRAQEIGTSVAGCVVVSGEESFEA